MVEGNRERDEERDRKHARSPQCHLRRRNNRTVCVCWLMTCGFAWRKLWLNLILILVKGRKPCLSSPFCQTTHPYISKQPLSEVFKRTHCCLTAAFRGRPVGMVQPLRVSESTIQAYFLFLEKLSRNKRTVHASQTLLETNSTSVYFKMLTSNRSFLFSMK